LLLDKPLGVSSAGAVARVKHLFEARKAGHTGSLDPLASGMLPICFGEATKFGALLLDADKTYRVTARLGERTPSARSETPVIERRELPEFRAADRGGARGFSARLRPGAAHAFGHQAGRRPLYEYARAGHDPRAAARAIVHPRACSSGRLEAPDCVRCALHEGRLYPRAGRGSGGAARHARPPDRPAPLGVAPFSAEPQWTFEALEP
jgi:tRNA pseudouridine55 synthase